MPGRLIAYLRAQDADEIARQRTMLADVATARQVLTAAAYFAAVIFLPFWLCSLLCAIDTFAEIYCLRAMERLDPAQNPRLYLLSLFWVVVAECCYSLASVLIWQLHTDYAKALAVAMVSLSLVQLTTMRTIHLPYAVVGLIAVVVTVTTGNAIHWLAQGDLIGFCLSTACIAAGAAFIWSAMRSNHALHVGLLHERGAAQAADQAKGRFLAQMSHELRTPLNAILGMGEAELVLSKQPDSQQRMAVLVTSARSLSVILDDILDMSAINQGSLSIRPAPANPRREVAATTALFRPMFTAAGLSLDMVCDPGLPEQALFDAQRLRQCLTNLLSNAAKFTLTGGAVVRLGPQATGGLQIDVTDTGPGLPETERDLAFMAFQRSHSMQAGSGLGLSISRALARSMGGDLVALPCDHGARFRLTIALPPVPATLDLAVAAPPTPVDLSGRRILVVDDIATNRLVAATYLRILGAEVNEAASGHAALRVMQSQCPDLVLLDMNMPGLSGTDTLLLIRAQQGRAGQVPVVAMTADATSAHRAQYLAAGLNGYLAKPLTLDSLRAALAEQLCSG
jgi:signal transduction histidine kinase